MMPSLLLTMDTTRPVEQAFPATRSLIANSICSINTQVTAAFYFYLTCNKDDKRVVILTAARVALLRMQGTQER